MVRAFTNWRLYFGRRYYLCNVVLHHAECNPVPHCIVASFTVYLCLCKSTLYVMTIWCATSWNCGNSHLYICMLSCNIISLFYDCPDQVSFIICNLRERCEIYIHLSFAWSFAVPACSCYILVPSSLFQTWQNWWKRDEIAGRRAAAGESKLFNGPNCKMYQPPMAGNLPPRALDRYGTGPSDTSANNHCLGDHRTCSERLEIVLGPKFPLW